ncbi:MAG: hypothetical protein LBF93_00610 [Zoogloeaceae bacterium]|jgi:hypothetical protein|nr:hypothetical protein [Zoogloeaceae bacterium]
MLAIFHRLANTSFRASRQAPLSGSRLLFMPRIQVFALFCLLTAPASTEELVYLTVKDQRVENGKILDMEFREIERTVDASIVRVIFVSGGSVSSSMFVLRGHCAVTRARGENYFLSQEIMNHPNTYRVTFPATAASDPQVRRESGIWAISDCKSLGFY